MLPLPLQQLGITYYQRRAESIFFPEYALNSKLGVLLPKPYSQMPAAGKKMLIAMLKVLALKIEDIALGFIYDPFKIIEEELYNYPSDYLLVLGNYEQYKDLSSERIYVAWGLEEMLINPKLKVTTHQELLKLKQKICI